MRHRKKSWI